MTEFNITPENFLRDLGLSFGKSGKFLTFRYCPFCSGGTSRDQLTFIVHALDGNYSCSRSKCGMRGSFWKLIEFYGRDPRDFRVDSPAPKTQAKKARKKGFIYGRT